MNITNKLDGFKKNLIGLSVKHLYGPKQIELLDEDVVVLCLVKNGGLYIKEFIEYYFSLGVKYIVFLDNGSSDETIKIAKKYDDVIILQTNFPFKKGNNMLMRDYLIERFAENKWSLCVDIDEFFDYPYSDVLSLKDLIKYLNENNYTAVVTQMLDMFPEKIVRGRNKKFHRKEHQYYEISNVDKEEYFFEGNRNYSCDINIHFGGIRKSIFGISPFLTKHALIFKDSKTERGRHGHLLNKGIVADFSAVLFHYKFNDNFFKKVEDAVRKKQYHNDSVEYVGYQKILKRSLSINFSKYDIKKFKKIQKLLGQDFLVVSRRYFDLVKHKIINNSLFKNSKKEDVAVVIGVKDRLDFRLENALKSIKNQDYNQDLIKIIIVDYGSEDEIADKLKNLCNKYEIEYKRVKNVQVWNRSHALNIGIKKAKTKYILCSDVDIIFEKNYISECIKELQRNPYQVIFSTMLDSPENDIDEKTDVISNYDRLRNKSFPRGGYKNGKRYIFGQSINMVLTEFYYEINGYDENYCGWGYEDDDVIERFRMIGLKITNIHERSSYIHQWHPKYEGLNEEQKKQIQKNKEYFNEVFDIIRNRRGWGELIK